jgi:hypothetical protein
MESSGEACDLLFVAPWMNSSFAQLVANGALAPMDDLRPAKRTVFATISSFIVRG